MWDVESGITGERKNIYGIVKLNNDWIDFEESPATLSGGMIRGYVRSENKRDFVVIPLRDVKLLWTRSGSKAFGVIVDLVSILGITFYSMLMPVISIPIIGLILII